MLFEPGTPDFLESMMETSDLQVWTDPILEATCSSALQNSSLVTGQVCQFRLGMTFSKVVPTVEIDAPHEPDPGKAEGDANDDDQTTLVQFTTAIYFVEESETQWHVEILVFLVYPCCWASKCEKNKFKQSFYIKSPK